jgi:hypothetical protein
VVNALTITTKVQDPVVIGKSYSATTPAATLTVTGGTPPYHWPARPLPPGLKLMAKTSTTAVLSGTPEADGAGIWPLDIEVTDSTPTFPLLTDVTLNLTVAPPGSAVGANYCPVQRLYDGEPAEVVILAGGVSTQNPGTGGTPFQPLVPPGYPTSSHPSSLTDGYCMAGHTKEFNDLDSAAPALQAIIGDYQGLYPTLTTMPSEQVSYLTNQLGVDGAVILPFSYKSPGANLSDPSGIPSAASLSVTGYGPNLSGYQRSAPGAALLETEVESVHAFWPSSTIFIVGHSQGGLVAATWWGDEAYDCQYECGTGVAAVVTLDSPLGGVQAGDVCAVVPAKACNLFHTGPPVTNDYSTMWSGWITQQADYVSDNASKQAALYAVGTPGDPVYYWGDGLTVSNETNAYGLYSQFIFSSAADSSWLAQQEPPPSAETSNDVTSACTPAPTVPIVYWRNFPNYHGLVRNCSNVIGFISCLTTTYASSGCAPLWSASAAAGGVQGPRR